MKKLNNCQMIDVAGGLRWNMKAIADCVACGTTLTGMAGVVASVASDVAGFTSCNILYFPAFTAKIEMYLYLVPNLIDSYNQHCPPCFAAIVGGE